MAVSECPLTHSVQLSQRVPERRHRVMLGPSWRGVRKTSDISNRHRRLHLGERNVRM